MEDLLKKGKFTRIKDYKLLSLGKRGKALSVPANAAVPDGTIFEAHYSEEYDAFLYVRTKRRKKLTQKLGGANA